MKHIIYISYTRVSGSKTDVIGFAVDEDGRSLGNHYCSGPEYVQHDMGVTSSWKHDHYDRVFGKDNWEVKWIANYKNIPEPKVKQ